MCYTDEKIVPHTQHLFVSTGISSEEFKLATTVSMSKHATNFPKDLEKLYVQSFDGLHEYY